MPIQRQIQEIILGYFSREAKFDLKVSNKVNVGSIIKAIRFDKIINLYLIPKK